MTVPVFETVFAVPMTCQSCINDIEGSLQQLSGTSAVGYRPYVRVLTDHDIGIHKVSANLKDQLVSVEGTAPPSAIVEAIQSTGRDAILRGSGKSDSEYAIVRFQCLRLTSISRRCSVHLGIARGPYREQGSRIGTDGRSSTWYDHHRFEHTRTVSWNLSRHCARKW
jgi:copper chaperone CopZ